MISYIFHQWISIITISFDNHIINTYITNSIDICQFIIPCNKPKTLTLFWSLLSITLQTKNCNTTFSAWTDIGANNFSIERVCGKLSFLSFKLTSMSNINQKSQSCLIQQFWTIFRHRLWFGKTHVCAVNHATKIHNH